MIPKRGRIPASLPSLEEIQEILLDTRNWTADGGLFLTSEDRIKVLALVEKTKTEHADSCK
jgi:hypothetical protein